MTEDQVCRVRYALNETHGLLARALAYDPKFQDSPAISFYRAHIIKLEWTLSAQPAPRKRRRLVLTVNGRTPAQLYRSAGAILGKPKCKA